MLSNWTQMHLLVMLQLQTQSLSLPFQQQPITKQKVWCQLQRYTIDKYCDIFLTK